MGPEAVLGDVEAAESAEIVSLAVRLTDKKVGVVFQVVTS